MSFYFSAGGSKEAAKASLRQQLETNRSCGGDMVHADIAVECLVKAIDGAPAGTEVQVIAAGHHNYGSEFPNPNGDFKVSFCVSTPIAP